MPFRTTPGNRCVDWQYMIGERWQNTVLQPCAQQVALPVVAPRDAQKA